MHIAHESNKHTCTKYFIRLHMTLINSSNYSPPPTICLSTSIAAIRPALFHSRCHLDSRGIYGNAPHPSAFGFLARRNSKLSDSRRGMTKRGSFESGLMLISGISFEHVSNAPQRGGAKQAPPPPFPGSIRQSGHYISLSEPDKSYTRNLFSGRIIYPGGGSCPSPLRGI